MKFKKKSTRNTVWAQHFRAQLDEMVAGRSNRWISERRKELMSVFEIRGEYAESVFQCLWKCLDRLEENLRNSYRVQLHNKYKQYVGYYHTLGNTKRKKQVAAQIRNIQKAASNFEQTFRAVEPSEEWKDRFMAVWRGFLARHGVKRSSAKDTVTSLAFACRPRSNGEKGGHFVVGGK